MANGGIRWCEDLGLYVLDRGRETCRWSTRFCRAYCYNKNLYKWQKAMKKRDKLNEAYWRGISPHDFQADLSRKKKSVDRFRICTRGEAFATIGDVHFIHRLLSACPSTLFWIPTRAWRDWELREEIENEVMTLHNARVLASTDPSTQSYNEREVLQRGGWSTVYMGGGSPLPGYHRCKKTWDGLKGECATCADGCFASYKRVDVHLRLHSGAGNAKHREWETLEMTF